MSPQEALAFLDKVCGQIQLNREGHMKMQQAINVLSMAIIGSAAQQVDVVTDVEVAPGNSGKGKADASPG